VCKTPYRVLDAPELADDFYLNLVDWSTTNVLGVGLGMSVYLWTAHTAAVSKLCDLASSADTISAVAWTQRVSPRALAYAGPPA
jgi:cell division cycle 20-like protein 1, cofactor of APC complex